MLCSDTGSTEAIHIPKKYIELAQKIQRIEDFVGEESPDGNAEFIIKLKVVGGKIARSIQLAGKWFPWG